jgi:hypothetical protein
VDGYSAEVMNEPGSVDHRRSLLVDPAAPGGGGGKLGDPGRVARKVRRDQVREESHRDEGAIDRGASKRQPWGRLECEGLVPGRFALLGRQDLGAAGDEAGRHLGIEGVARPLAGEADRVIDTAEATLESGVRCDVDDPHR